MRIEKLSPTEKKLVGNTAKRQKTAVWLNWISMISLVGGSLVALVAEWAFIVWVGYMVCQWAGCIPS